MAAGQLGSRFGSVGDVADRVISWRTRSVIFGSVLVLSVLIGWLTTRDSGSSSSDAVSTLPGVGLSVQDPTIGTNPDLDNTQLPNLTIANLNGDTVSLRSLIGSPMVINLWFAACAPCKAEMPEFVKAQAKVGQTVRFIGLDTADSTVVAKQFADSVGAHYELFTDPGFAALNVLKISVMPTTLFVAADGHITSIQSGAMTEDTLLARIDKELLPS